MTQEAKTQEQIYPRPLSQMAINNAPSALVPARTELAGAYITLEPLDDKKHTQALYDAGHDSPEALSIWDYLAYGPWPDVESYRAVIRNQSASFDPIFYAIRCNKSGEICGQISLLDINAQNGVAEIGHIWFAPKLQRTQGATEAMYIAMDYAMSDLGYRRMQWRCNSLNEKSRSAAKRLGFRHEGIFYNHLIFKGKNRDTAWYSILDDEWPEVKDKLSTWLSTGNFDTNGTALTSLSALMATRQSSRRPFD